MLASLASLASLIVFFDTGYQGCQLAEHTERVQVWHRREHIEHIAEVSCLLRIFAAFAKDFYYHLPNSNLADPHVVPIP